MISQPRMSWTMFSASTMASMPAENEREAGEEVGVATIAAHVLERVDLHERGDERDEQQQHDGEAVDVLAESELDAAALPPGPAADDGLDVGLATLCGTGTRPRANDARRALLAFAAVHESTRWIHW